MSAVLEIRGLRVGLRDGGAEVVHGVDFTIGDGERVGLVGESGSGKSVMSLATIGLLPRALEVSGGSIEINGDQVVGRPERDLIRLRGKQVAMIYQNPLNSLNPVRKVGVQIVEAIRVHNAVGAREARERAIDLLDQVGIREPSRSVDLYPHEFSGGMRQRAMIAMAISCDPALLLADEPTTALDVTTQAKILDLLLELSEARRMAVLLVTHNLAVANGFCNRIGVMYRGTIVESGETEAVLSAPRHPYTQALKSSLCTMETDRDRPLYSRPEGTDFPTDRVFLDGEVAR